MKILDRYLVKGFLAPFGICAAIFCILVVLARYFDKMEIFNNFHAHARDIAIFLILGLPYWLNLVLPVATLLALLFSLGALQQHGELTACRSAGIPLHRLYFPYYGIGFVLSVISLVGGLTFLPRLNFESRSLYRVRIKHGQALNYRNDHVVAAGQNHRRFTIGWLDVEHNQMKDVVVDRFGDNLQWVETLSAKNAYYEDGKWRLVDGALRRLDPEHPGNVLEEPFKEKVVDIREKPRDFAFEDKVPDDMTGREIIRRISWLRRLGVAANRESVAFHLKIALPFANLVVIALGIPFALRSGHKGRTQTFAYALGLTFLYWGLTSICQSFGEQGRMPAWLAAWMSNIVFTGVAVWMLRKVNG